ncbi:hypothetical protein BRCON_2432 [Candidatus Sumerlaea chitinivorans]|uniref:Uncharacterized protein n=1 Tax=Sumerlaea chitinivorans TaxID=2250252 RepID=A0A2Z4Y963_SUMC1|nr:hypothetical protein BRCON_2432 [Candidatus Sumerlaea chitinivorans]
MECCRETGFGGGASTSGFDATFRKSPSSVEKTRRVRGVSLESFADVISFAFLCMPL